MSKEEKAGEKVSEKKMTDEEKKEVLRDLDSNFKR